MKTKSYTFKGEVWKYKFDGATAWHFITVPKHISSEIKFLSTGKTAAWGSLRITAKIGETEWQTSLFPDSKSGCYLLPVKAAVRRAEKLGDGTRVTCMLRREA